MVDQEERLIKLEQKVLYLEEKIDKDIEELNVNVKDLLEAWRTGTGLVKFIKWSSSIVIACVAMYWVGIDVIKRTFDV